MNYLIKINPNLCKKIIKTINIHGLNTPNTQTTFLSLKNQLKVSQEKLEDHLFFLEYENYIEKNFYTQQKKDKRYIGFVDYALDNKGINFLNENPVLKLPTKHTFFLKISNLTANTILKTIKHQNQLGTLPKKYSSLISIYKKLSNIDFPKFYNHIIYLQKIHMIKIKRYGGKNIGYEDILVL